MLMVAFGVFKYKIIITLILFCFFQTTPSISLELKLPKKLGDLKKITEDIKKKIEKKEPEVKKEEVKKEEVKKEEVKKEEVKEINESFFINKRIEFKFNGKYCRYSKVYYFYSENYYEAFYGCNLTHNPTVFNPDFGTWKLIKERTPSSDILFEFEKEIYSNNENKADIITTREVSYTNGSKGEIESTIRIDLKKFIGFVHTESNADPSPNRSGWNVKIADIDTKDTNYYAVKSQKEKEQKKEAEKQAAGAAQNAKVEKLCKEFIEKIEGEKKSKTLGGYKDFYFGMSKTYVLNFVECKGYFNKEIFYNDFTQERGKAKGYFIQNMYKYNTGVRLKDGKVNSIDVQLSVNVREKTFYSGKATEEFEQIKKVVLDKYELIAEPTKISIDEFNKEKYGRLEWVLKSNIEGNLILLIFKQSPGQTKYFYTGKMDFLSPEESKIYMGELDSKVIKSDDL